MGSLTSLFAAAVNFIAAGSNTVYRSVQSKERDIVSIEDFAGANYDVKFANAEANGAQDIYIPAGTYNKVLPWYTLSPAGASKRWHGAGRDKTIIVYAPAVYSDLNFACWVGDHTNNPPVAYAVYPEIRDLTIQGGTNSAGFLRTRLCLSGMFSNLALYAIPGQSVGSLVNYFWGLMIEANQDCTYEGIDVHPDNGQQNGAILTTAVDIHQARQTHPNAGNYAILTTTTRINNSYIHVAADLVVATGYNSCSINTSIFESGVRGVAVGAASWPLDLNDCHWESVSTYPLQVGAAASCNVNGGYYGPPTSVIGSGTIAGDTFATGTNCNSLKIRGLAVGGTPQSSLVASTGSGKITIDALTISPTILPNAPVNPTNGDITTVAASAVFTVRHIGHGLTAGAVVGLTGYTSPYQTLLLNQPFYRITLVVDVDHYQVQSILFPALTAAGNGTQAGTGAERVIVYPSNCWLNCVIQEPDRVELADCITQELLFNQAFGAASGAVNIFYGGITTGQHCYVVDDWTYIMTAQGFSSANPAGVQTATVIVSMGSGYDPSFTFASLPTNYTINVNGEYQTTVVPIGLKIPPGSAIFYKSDNLVASNLQGRIIVARTGIK